MKISIKLILSFSAIVVFILALIMMNWAIMGKVSQQSAINEQVYVLSRNIYLEETLADAYIRQAASEYFESSEIPLEPEHIARGFYQIHDNNSVLIDKLEQMLSADEEKKALSAISEKHEELKNVFDKHHQYYKNKLNKLAHHKEEGEKIADLRHSLKVIVTDPAYFEAYSKNTVFYSPVSKKIEEKNVLTLFRQLGYKEKEYVWQYREKIHQDDVLAVVTEMEAIVPLTSVPASTKSNITSLLAGYKNHSINFIDLIEEKDLDRISALSHKYSRELFNLRQDDLNNKYVYNPAYGDKIKQFKTIKVGNTEIRASLEYLVFELGHHEKEILYQDKGMKTVHYDEIIMTYDSINALVKELNLSQRDVDGISSLLATHKIGLDSFMKTRTENEEAISEMREEKTIKISEMRKIVEEIQEGKSDDEKSGLNYLARVQGDKTTVQMNILNNVNLIGGLFALLAAIGIGLYIPYSISKPLANLNRTANDIGKGNLDAKIEIRSKDEIGELAASFNKMTQDLRVSRDDIISAKKYTDNIVRSMTDTLLVVSPDGIIQTVNPATCTLLGYKEKELIGEPVSKVVAEGKEIPINFSTFLRQYFLIGSMDNDLVKECCIKNVEKTYLAKDGRKIPMLFSGSVMRDDNGNIQGIVCVAQDITERKQAEEALKKLSSAVEQSADSVIITNKDGFIEYINPAFEKLTGYNKEEAIGNTPNILKSGKHDKKYYQSLYDVIHSGKVFQDELINKKKNGELYYAATTIVPITDAQGTITHFVTTEKDITEHKKAEKIHLENERLSYASKAKSEFLANMSHELRTPLNSIIGFSELLKQKMFGELNEKQEHHVDNILTSGNFLLNLISDILDLSKVEAGKMELVIEKIHVPEVINESLILMKEKAAKHNVKLKLDLDPKLDYIEADRLRIKQVLFNLLSNAVKFSKPEGGTVTITAKKEGDRAKFSVSDTGIGIREEDMGRRFNTFEQLDSGMTRKYGGTGLGLAISKKLVELHGGNIRVESKFGIGTTFYFIIPIKRGN